MTNDEKNSGDTEAAGDAENSGRAKLAGEGDVGDTKGSDDDQDVDVDDPTVSVAETQDLQGQAKTVSADVDDVEVADVDASAAVEDVEEVEVDTATAAELAEQISQLRAEYDVLQRELEASTKPKTKRLHRPSRRWASIACVVVGAILLPLAVLVQWTSNTVLDTDSYVETVAPLAQNKDIQEALSFRISEIIIEVIDIRELTRDALPPAAAFLAAPVESGVRVLIQDVVEGLVSTGAFESLWEDANRLGHDSVVAVLTGEGNDQVDTSGGKVVIHLGPFARNVLTSLDDILGIDLADSIPDQQLNGEFVLVQSSGLASLQDEIRWFDRLSWLIPILTIALLVGSVILSRPRRLGFRRLGIAIVAPMTISLLLYTWLRGQYIDGLSENIHNPDAATAFFDITTRFVQRDFRVLLVLGVLILFLTWLFGPTGWAGRARAWWNTLVGKAGDASTQHDVGEAPKWVAKNERTLLVAGVALGALTLVVWTRPTGLVVLLVIAVAGLAMAAVSIFAEIGRRAELTDVDTPPEVETAKHEQPNVDTPPEVETAKHKLSSTETQ